MLLDRSQTPRLIVLFIGLCLLAYALYVGFNVTTETIAAMNAQGWTEYLGLPVSSVGVFTAGCLGNSACREPFLSAWSEQYSWWIPIAAMVCLIASTLLMYLVDGLPKGADKAPGGARWARDFELSSLLKEGKSAYASPLRGYIGHTASGKLLKVPENKRNAHSLIIGGPGSGKTTRYFKQNLLMDALEGTCSIVLDLKYPDSRGGFFDMVPFFQQQGYDVQLFLPFDAKTLSMPLLLGGDTFEGASEFARMVIPVNLEASDAEFYHNQERKLLTGLVLAMTRNGETSLRKLYRLLVAGRESVSTFISKYADREVQELFQSFFELDAGKLGGIINGLEGRLQIFYDETLDKSTTKSDYPWENIDLDALGTKKSMLYIGVPQEKLLSGDGKLLLQLIKRTLDRALLKNARANNGSLPIAASFYLDEFPSFGELPNMEENFATMRSYKVGYHVAIQNRAQLESVYGRETANALLTNLFQHIVFFPRYLKFDDATFFSEALGEMTAIEESRGRRASVALLDLQQNTVNKKEVARPLMSVEEMMSWPDAVGVVIANGMPPIKALMPRLDETHTEGKRNLLHRYYDLLPNGVNVVKLRNEILLRRHATMFKQLAPTGALTDITKAKEERKEKASLLTPSPVKQVAPMAEVKESFLNWLEAALQHQPAVVLHKEQESGRVTKATIDTSTLPQELREPAGLNDWTKQRVLKVQRDKFGIIGDAIAWLGKDRLAQLATLALVAPTAKTEPHAQKQAQSVPQPVQAQQVQQQARQQVQAGVGAKPKKKKKKPAQTIATSQSKPQHQAQSQAKPQELAKPQERVEAQNAPDLVTLGSEPAIEKAVEVSKIQPAEVRGEQSLVKDDKPSRVRVTQEISPEQQTVLTELIPETLREVAKNKSAPTTGGSL
jgi:type IV secretion system protein VirD4